ncbi:glycosyl hydrolase-related protein [Acetatifactor muris]|uniref:Mannosylglycerate hydrolase n=1 Tax=Acetatifactor muris TaxID=879566 RepID=A0A2K4ZNP1_9FIRM|nr:glycoside hydrolase family 38 C-terminal domain-containing protein [Acetatifactor muris]MCI8798341.1 alpha-mannosidase [Lachnospiraceae bacterium]MCR2050444.1 glycosyl hydrolase-related protein [Acetatifactor muris]SOY32070.1 Mannosylglycerate hydrolase [Acetatifactor muris]
MKLMHSEWQGRLEHWLRTLRDDFYESLGEISWEAFRTMEQLSMEEAQTREFVPVQPGFTWGNIWEYCWFRGSITLPEQAKGQRIVMNLKPGGESALFVNGKSFGTYRADWLDVPHHYMEDNVLTPCAEGKEHFDILMETYAGHFYPEAPTGGCATGPVLPGSYEDPAKEGERRKLEKCTYGIWNEAAYQLYMDVDTLARLLTTLDEKSLRAAKIAKALEKFTLTVDFEQPKEARIASYLKAREELRPVMEAKNGSTAPVFYAIGNAHIDLAWLWPMAETYRKTERTFAAQLRLIEEYPEYKFIQSQPAAYEMCRKYYPELFERIREAVKGGQWIADGAMWVEPDTNVAGGEALIRQLVHGKRYYKEMFDVDSRVLWLPDTFGYTAALPQILKGCGVDYLVTQKIFWSYNEGDQFPYHYFTWQGMDGSQIVSFLPTSYTYRTDPVEANTIWKERTQMQDLDAFLMPYGYGDGGGGPARDFVEYAKRQEDLEGSVKMKMAGPLEFFEDMEKQGGPVNTYVGELYFSAHRGTYTSQAAVKKNNRRSELAMRELELWSSLALSHGLEYDLPEADALWKEILLHQFHDILPGSCIGRVYEEAREAHGKILEGAEKLQSKALEALTEPGDTPAVTVWNSLSFEREALVELPEAFAEGAQTLEGEKVPVQQTEGKVKALVRIPSCGAVSLIPGAGAQNCAENCTAGKNAEKAVLVKETGENYLLENNKVKAVINGKGEITSFVLKESGREFAAGPLNRLRLYKDVPRLFDAWDIDSNYIEQEVEALTDAHVEVVTEGLEGVLKVSGRISESPFVQYIRLAADSERIVFETEIDWKELHRLLKAAFPVNVYAENGINEMQFGYVERPAHRSRLYDKDRFEVCNHRYSAFCDGSHGAAVLNDCKYGISMNDNALELTLLRAAATPEMRADNGMQTFTYAFTAWEGSFADCDVVRQGYELNVTPPVTAGSVNRFSGLNIDRANVILDTMKPAEDGSGDVILRLYEAKKAATDAEISFGFDVSGASACDMLENVTEELKVVDGKLKLSFRAFEIKTIRVKR